MTRGTWRVLTRCTFQGRYTTHSFYAHISQVLSDMTRQSTAPVPNPFPPEPRRVYSVHRNRPWIVFPSDELCPIHLFFTFYTVA